MKKAGKVVVFLRAKDIKISRIACLTGRRFLGKEKKYYTRGETRMLRKIFFSRAGCEATPHLLCKETNIGISWLCNV